ncbi:hypothetical protein bcgnr5372_27280 [Bacillus luti]|nr:hypothetical protein [Bacillus cereus]HDR8331184.1 hypothetical protein [Bacillus cereus]HDR8338035.1 hypothetical protein [Bacillus cereus]
MGNNTSIINIRINSWEEVTFDRCKLQEVLRKYSWADIDEFRQHAKFEDYEYILRYYEDCVVKLENVVADQIVIK